MSLDNRLWKPKGWDVAGIAPDGGTETVLYVRPVAHLTADERRAVAVRAADWLNGRSPAQHGLLEALRALPADADPSLRRLAAQVGITKSWAQVLVDQLTELGDVERPETSYGRGIRLVRD